MLQISLVKVSVRNHIGYVQPNWASLTEGLQFVDWLLLHSLIQLLERFNIDRTYLIEGRLTSLIIELVEAFYLIHTSSN